MASHPAVAGALLGLDPEAVGALAARPDLLPLASEHGGFFFGRTDAMGFSCELHTLFTPEGWGREVLLAALEAFAMVFSLGFALVTTFEVETNAKSRPPLTFGFAIAGDWRETPVGTLRLWILTREAWMASPARRRHLCH